jgi:hypothetical protein
MTFRKLAKQMPLWNSHEKAQPAEAANGKEIFERVFRSLRPRTPLPEFEVKFRPYADINNVIRIRDGKVLVGLSDLLQNAPRTVLEAIAVILLAKLYRKPIPEHCQSCYRRFLNRRSVRHQAQAIRRERGRKWIGEAAGLHFHLEEIFDQINREYFEGSLRRPRLSWSRAASRSLLGHFDTAHNAIIISKVFDRPQVPQFLVEYILYHEMLHLKHPVKHTRDRRCFHSPLFRAEEKRFARFAEAKVLLEEL